MSGEPRFPCPRCGEEQPWVEVTQFGDREPRYAQTYLCPCPGPRCPFSHGRLDDERRCTDMDCYMFGLPVPVPEIA
jgi:hypothetical protein